MANEDIKKDQIDKPTPFVVYAISILLGFIVFLPLSMGFMYLIRVAEYVGTEPILESSIIIGLVTGLVLAVVVGIIFGSKANKQIIDASN